MSDAIDTCSQSRIRTGERNASPLPGVVTASENPSPTKGPLPRMSPPPHKDADVDRPTPPSGVAMASYHVNPAPSALKRAFVRVVTLPAFRNLLEGVLKSGPAILTLHRF